MGPEPVLISRTQMDALYTILEALATALAQLDVPWILTGVSLPGTVREQSILFTDDNVDLAIIGEEQYAIVAKKLQKLLAGRRVRLRKKFLGGWRSGAMKESLELCYGSFVMGEFKDENELREAIRHKANGQHQTSA